MRRLAIVLAALVIAGCGEEEAQHGPATTEAEHAAHGEEAGGGHGEAARGPGVSDAHDLKLELNPSSQRAGQGGELSFKILDAGGDSITKFEVEHTKQLHLIVVSKDLLHFQHVHPEVSDHGNWRAPVDFDDPGEYRVIADVKHDGEKLALSADLTVEGDPQAVGRPATDADFVDQELKAGQPTTLQFEAPGAAEPYLGAAGHLVILSEGDLEYLHVHPQKDALEFEATFPKPGKYVMFLEVKRDGKVSHARFPVTVS